MGNIRCLNCNKEITMISGMECPHCKAKLSHVKIAFLSFLGPEDSLAGYSRSYKLVLLKCVFSMLRYGQELSAQKVTEAFRAYYLARVRAGFLADKGVDSRIEDIENTSLKDVWLIIQMNPLGAIQKQGYMRAVGEGLNGKLVLQEELNKLTDKELENLISFLDRKLAFYYRKKNSRAVDWTYMPPARQIEANEEETPIAPEDARDFAGEGEEECCQEDPSLEAEKDAPAEVATIASELMESTTPIEELSLSTRAFNVAKRNKIDTLGQLARAFCDGSFAKMRNVGKNTVEEIAGVLNNPTPKTHEEVFSCGEEISEGFTEFSADSMVGIADMQISEVFEGNIFNPFVYHCHLTGRNKIRDLVGFTYEELLTIRGLGAKKCSAVLEKFKEIEQLVANGMAMDAASNGEPSALMQEKKIHIHPTNRGCTLSILRLVGISTVAIARIAQAEYSTLGDLDGTGYKTFTKKVSYGNTDALLKAVEQFEKPFEEVLGEILNEYAKGKAFGILLCRAEGRTLQNVAEEYGITRERVRQICSSAVKKLNDPCSVVAEQLMAENGGNWFRKEQICGVVANLSYAKMLEFFFENSDSYYYMRSSDLFLQKVAFPDVENRLRELADDIVGDGISILESADKIEATLEATGFGFITSDDFLGLLKDLEYNFYGDYVVKNWKSYGMLCARIVEKEFPDGISNTEEDLTRLRELVQQKYGDLGLPESNRALFARLSDCLILRGRAKYIAPAKVYADESILAEVKNYIDASKQKDILYSELFAEFEGLLLMMTNIDNAHFLHGVLRHYYPADYSYSRDFLSKDSGEAGQNLADRINAYISSTGCAVSKKDIFRQFPGISEAVLWGAAYRFTGLLQWEYGYFNSLDNLHLTNDDVQKIDDVINSLLEENNGYCSEAMLYARAQAELEDVIEKNSVKNGQNLFFIAQELLAGKYTFRSPHIARNGRFEALDTVNVARSALENDTYLKASDYFRLTKRFMWPDGTAWNVFAEIEKDYIRLNVDEYVHRNKFSLSEADLQHVRVLLGEGAGSNWFLPLQVFADSEEELPAGIAVNEFIMGALTTEYELGWHVVAPKIKDRRYQRGILVRDDISVFAYDELISCVLKEQKIESIFETDLLGFLQIHSLVNKVLPKELQQSDYFAYNDGMYTVK